MSAVIESIRARAAAADRVVVLPEAYDARTLEAAALLRRRGVARLVLLGAPDEVVGAAPWVREAEGVEVLDPQEKTLRRECAELYLKLRRHKGVTEEEAWETAGDELYCGACLLHLGRVDGMVAGAANTTAKVLRALLQVVRMAPGIQTVSSCFILETGNEQFGHHGALLVADGGVVPRPTAQQLADIAIATADSARLYLETEPRVAMLSFSTKGSAFHPDVQKVVEATQMAQSRRPDLLLDGELQADAALVPEVAALKCPDSPVGGRANVLIMPDLGAGNIGYKLIQRMTNCPALGPLVQGLAKPGMDLSRGACADEIADVVAVAALRAGRPAAVIEAEAK